MEIILKRDMENLGHENDLVNVKSGYGRNFLIPKGYAILATASVKKMHEENIRQKAHKEEKLKNDAIALAAQLENKKLKISAKASSTGKIFGSVGNIQLAEAIAKKGVKVDKKNISIEGDIVKEIGAYTATIKLHKEVKVEIEFKVVAE
ncbi:MAG: 50S ribosomal protein L9 [Bacteroidetes bacterium]|jgi:large subunit ribosomal protein L9|nr:50S ribosomal protein L9 [Bacteroidota bacterium]MBT6686572.1 50S ribosomal protein L9 [Bacteroidota bacterium]MBT7142935.1 50S ribosomal protein L9 [Bacteroidota bacterium]MBT7490616.1 50S ribosomal protein L9 [Bacteroidota bacterium]